MKNNKNFTVAHSVPSWLPLTENWIYNQLQYMASINSLVLAHKLENVGQFPWDPLYHMSSYEYFFFRVLRKFGYRWHPNFYHKAIVSHQPIILHSHFGHTGWQDVPIVKNHQLKQVVTFYGFDVNMLLTQNRDWYDRYQELFSTASLFLCEGPHMAQSLISIGCPEAKVTVQRLGVEVDKLAYKPRVYRSEAPLKILIASSFKEKKGIPYALEAVGLLRENHPKLTVTIIGDSNGTKAGEEEKKKIFHIIEKYRLQPYVRFLGYQPHSVLIKEAYDHHIFLTPSVTASDGDTEGGAPVTIIEMMATGMPVVSTTHCDIPQIITHGETGLLAEERDVGGLVLNLQWLLDNYDQWARMTGKGRHRIETNFDASIQANKLITLYQQVCEA